MIIVVKNEGVCVEMDDRILGLRVEVVVNWRLLGAFKT